MASDVLPYFEGIKKIDSVPFKSNVMQKSTMSPDFTLSGNATLATNSPFLRSMSNDLPPKRSCEGLLKPLVSETLKRNSLLFAVTDISCTGIFPEIWILELYTITS